MIRAVRFEGQVYRALNPRWAADPLSGEGVRLHGGRFNRRGTPALYTSLSPVTAMREAQQAGGFQPITLVAYRLSASGVFDGTDVESLEAAGTSAAALADPGWREATRARGLAPTQELGERLLREGFAGLIVPSYAPGAETGDGNLVLLRWNSSPDDLLTVIDDEGRLGARKGEAPLLSWGGV